MQDIGDVRMFILQVKTRLIDYMTQTWHSDINDSSRYVTYNQFKTLLNVEKYLCIDMLFYLRKAFARFRCSSHKCNIETGRHRGIDRAGRICFYCLDQLNRCNVEDEYHIFFVCPKYTDLREQNLLTWYQYGDSKIEFFNLISATDTVKVRKLCLYINALLKCTDAEQ